MIIRISNGSSVLNACGGSFAKRKILVLEDSMSEPLSKLNSVSPPENDELRISIEQAAKHCAANPSFYKALHAASMAAGSLPSKTTASPYNFMFDSNAEGHAYFNSFLHLCQKQSANINSLRPSLNYNSQCSSSTSMPSHSFKPYTNYVSEKNLNPQETNVYYHTNRMEIPPEPPLPYNASSSSTFGNSPHTYIPRQATLPYVRLPPPPQENLSGSYNSLRMPMQPISMLDSCQLPPFIIALNDLKNGNVEPKSQLIYEKTIDFITRASVTLVGITKLDAGFNAILPFYPTFVASNPNHQVASCILHLCTQDAQSFVGRLSVSLLAYVLMTTGNVKREWCLHMLPHFPWILRLCYLAGCSTQEQALVLAIVQKSFDLSVITQDQRSFFLFLIQSKTIPNVPSIFNTPLIQSNNSKQTQHKTKFKFDSGTVSSTSVLPDVSKNTSTTDKPPQEDSIGSSLSTSANQSVTTPEMSEPTNVGDVNDKGIFSIEKPDQISGGALASFLKLAFKRTRHLHAAFIPYKPLDALPLPASAYPLDLSADYLQERLHSLEQELKTQFSTYSCNVLNQGNTSVSKNSFFDVGPAKTHFSKDDDSYYDRMVEKKKNLREFRERDSYLTSTGEARWEKPVAWAQAEMGISEDGTLLGEGGMERPGLGALSKISTTSTSAADELFDDYRKQRAHKYHKTIAQAQAERASEDSKDPSRLCFICQKAGHLARECKFGLT